MLVDSFLLSYLSYSSKPFGNHTSYPGAMLGYGQILANLFWCTYLGLQFFFCNFLFFYMAYQIIHIERSEAEKLFDMGF